MRIAGRGIILQANGTRLRVNAPEGALTLELREALAAHKGALLPLSREAPADTSPPPDAITDAPCPRCGAADWRHTPDAGRWCVSCVLAGRDQVAAVKVHSAVLDTETWVVCDDLPREAWPQDGAAVYTDAEVKILTQVGPDILTWVHAVKESFGGRVVSSRPRPPLAPEINRELEEMSDG